MTLGPDGNVWFVDTGANRIVRVTPDGTMTPYSTGIGSNAGLAGITAGPDGNIYFTESNRDRIGRINLTTFVITESAPMGGGSDPRGITTGPDGALWFAEGTDDKIGRITTGLLVTDEFDVSGNNMRDITAGPDGNLWFTNALAGCDRPHHHGRRRHRLPDDRGSAHRNRGGAGRQHLVRRQRESGRDRQDHDVRHAPITLFTTGLTTNGAPLDIVAGADGNLYFTENANPGRLGQITTAGAITEFSTGLTAASGPWGIASGADGNIWFTENAGNRVGRLNFAPGAVTDPATQIHATDATLAGTVTPRSQATTYSFDWGLTTRVRVEHRDRRRRQRRIRAVRDGLHQRARSRHDLPLPRRRDQRGRHDAGRGSHVHDVDRSSRRRPPATASLVGETSATLNAVVNPNGADDDLPLRRRPDDRLRRPPARGGRRGRVRTTCLSPSSRR